MSTLEDNKKKMADVVKELWKDPSEVTKLQRDPKGYLKGKGVVIEGDKDVQVILEEPNKLQLYLPKKPDNLQKLSTQDLGKISDSDLSTAVARTLSASKEMF